MKATIANAPKGKSPLLEKALLKLKQAGYKVTQARRMLLGILLTEHGPFTVEALHTKVADQSCDLVTVYRNMAIFEELKLVQTCDFGDGSVRYEFTEGHSHHHHIICRSCHKAENLDFCFVKEVEKLVMARGFTNVTHNLEFFGVCQNCQR